MDLEKKQQKLYKSLPNKIDKLFLDLDDVLVDCVGQAFNDLRGKPAKSDQDLIDFMSNENSFKMFWEIEPVLGLSWWANLPLLPWAKNLISVCQKITDNFAILTSPSWSPNAAAGKIMWSNNFFGGNKTIMTRDKYLVASKNCVLVDDQEKFCNRWKEYGGIPIKLSRPWTPKGYVPGDVIKVLKLKYLK